MSFDSPALVGVRVGRIVARAGIRHLHHDGGVFIVAHVGPAELLWRAAVGKAGRCC